MTSNIDQDDAKKTNKLVILFSILSIVLLFLIIATYKSATKERRLPSFETKKEELAVRGDILSKDNFKIASSIKVYKTTIDTRFLDLEKKDLFIQLFSIYSNIPTTTIRKKIDASIKEGKGNLVLSYNIDSKTAKNLKELNYKLRRLDVFKSINIGGKRLLTALDVVVSGEKRDYSYGDTLTPIIGYTRKFESENERTRLNGIKGLEGSYNGILNEFSNGVLKGNRDVLSYITFNKNSIIKNKQDGASLILNIPLKLQKSIELQLDDFKEKYDADEIIVSIMDSTTGEILALATSNRFSPERIEEKDIPNLNVSASEYQFEPGSIMKPIAISLVIDKKKIKNDELFFAYNNGKTNKNNKYPKGKYKLGRYFIGDDHQFDKNYLSLEDIVIFSSNIGTLQLAQRLTGKEFSDGFKKFGFTKKTGIDLTHEAIGYMPSVQSLSIGENGSKYNVYKATVAYGQGMTSTFMQMLKAYSVFNNDGYAVTPQIISKLYINNQFYKTRDIKPQKVISKESANLMRDMLIRTVTNGTGKSANVEGVEVGGKTGTAQIAGKGGYQKKYISSFFGFANDEKNKYTIGVTVINPDTTNKPWYYYYASQNAAPIFKQTVRNLIKLNYLSPQTNVPN